MNPKERHVEEEMADLKEEIDRFKEEKERVRSIVGKIGGMPTFHTKIFNIVFVTLIVVSLAISLVTGQPIVRLAMIELAVAALSLKLILLMNNQARVNHFQLWILSSVEWRLNEVVKAIEKERDEDQRVSDTE
jgi:hypothetical protein